MAERGGPPGTGMFQQTVQCRACQRAFLVSTLDPVQLDVRCPLCGLTLVYPNPRQPGAHPPDSIVPWDPAWSDCG
jgi:DNA-directed RNA polymerase subunit RPC12/RpoP